MPARQCRIAKNLKNLQNLQKSSILADFNIFFIFDLTNRLEAAIITHAFGRLAQLVEHPLDVRKVAGSSPTSSTILEKSELKAGWQRVRISCFYR